MPTRLHLRAEDLDDVAAFSALAQDFVARARDIGFDMRARRLVLLGNRFCWETGRPMRTRTALVLSSLLNVKRRNWPEQGETMMDLLAIEAEPGGEAVTLLLHFAGGAAIRAQAECVDLLLDDLAEPVPTPRRPVHRPG